MVKKKTIEDQKETLANLEEEVNRLGEIEVNLGAKLEDATYDLKMAKRELETVTAERDTAQEAL